MDLAPKRSAAIYLLLSSPPGLHGIVPYRNEPCHAEDANGPKITKDPTKIKKNFGNFS